MFGPVYRGMVVRHYAQALDVVAMARYGASKYNLSVQMKNQLREWV